MAVRADNKPNATSVIHAVPLSLRRRCMH
jgi:hypothetical protein